MDLIEQLKGTRTLLIVNDPMFLDEMELAFEEADLHLEAYDSAEYVMQAVDLDQYDAIICCNELSGIKGLEFFRRIRRDHPHTIKILCGESSDTAVVAETYKNRIHDFLLKPFPFKILLATLCMHMRNRRHAAHGRQAERPRKAHCTAPGDAQWQIS